MLSMSLLLMMMAMRALKAMRASALQSGTLRRLRGRRGAAVSGVVTRAATLQRTDEAEACQRGANVEHGRHVGA